MNLSQNLSEMIDAFVSDGILTQTERDLLRKNALLEGHDPKEVEAYIEARLQDVRLSQAKKLRKCPACGAMLGSLDATCPSCGHEVPIDDSSDSTGAIRLANEMDKAFVGYKSGTDKAKFEAELESLIRKSRLLYGENRKMVALTNQIEAELATYKSAQKKKKRRAIYIRVVLWTTLAAVSLFLTYKWMAYAAEKNGLSSPSSERNEAKELSESERARVDAEYRRVCKAIDDLGEPNAEDYNSLRYSLLNIAWENITGDKSYKSYESIKKESYLKKKRAYASVLGTIYKEAHGESDPTDEIRYPELYIKN